MLTSCWSVVMHSAVEVFWYHIPRRRIEHVLFWCQELVSDCDTSFWYQVLERRSWALIENKR